MNKIVVTLASFFIVFHAASQNIPVSSTFPQVVTERPLPAYIPAKDTAASYVRSIVPRIPIVDSALLQVTTNPDSASITTVYLDQLGRKMQVVAKQATPLWKDMVSVFTYDGFERETTSYLPFVDNSSDGSYKYSAFKKDSTFYKSIFPNDHVIYSFQEIEASPLQRLKKSFAPGDDWGGAGKAAQISYRTNLVHDSVVYFTIGINNENDVPVKYAYYQPGTLYVSQTTNEENSSVVEYKDQQGRVVMTKTQLAPTPGTAHVGWLCTYYVYDEAGHLRTIIPPKAVDILNNSTVNWVFSSVPNALSDLCYIYYYDNLGRPIIKNIPGKGWMYTIYDMRGRVVMSQDPKMRLNQDWAFVQYDVQDRPLKTGIITNSSSKETIAAAAAVSDNYPQLTGNYTVYTETYYDNYNWTAGTLLNSTLDNTNLYSGDFINSYNISPYYASDLTATKLTRGAVTGSKVLILNSGDYQYSLQLYDDKGNALQSKSTNTTGGTDINTAQFNFSGNLLRSYLRHDKHGTNAQIHTLATKYEYDIHGRLLNLSKKFDGLPNKVVTQLQYNELGQVSQKQVGSSLEVQNFEYNIKGWLTSINKDFVNGTNTSKYFGEELSYNSGFTNNRLDGNVAGVKWRAAGDKIQRAFGYSYDLANRLKQADFVQQNTNGAAWTKDVADFSVSNLQYDAGGNILSATRKAMLIGSSSIIDSLQYSYAANSNRLLNVTDLANTPAMTFGDFTDSTAGSNDYAYDANGNIITDYNKHLYGAGNTAGMVFNYLDKAESITIRGELKTQYGYTAAGQLLSRQVSNNAGKIKSYSYISGFVYKNDTLLYTLFEGGRIRNATKINSTNGQLSTAFEFDYFLTDHMGNVRTVLTEGIDTLRYQATAEAANTTTENAIFSNLYTPTNTTTGKPANFDTDNNNATVVKLNGTGNKTGPGMMLKVMAGDKLQINTYAFYNGPAQAPTGSPTNFINNLLSLITTGVLGNSGDKFNGSSTTSLSNALTPNLDQFVNNQTYDGNRPKAYLNYIFFDNQFKLVSANSGSIQVLAGSSKQALIAPLQQATVNGYMYVYVSNESPQDVYFDDLTVTHTTGPLLQENQYYPYGLSMATISDKAALKLKNNLLYNGGTDLEDEDGITYYNTFYRKYDAQLGRFTGIDMLAEQYIGLNPYQFGANNPVMFNDPMGDQLDMPMGSNGRQTKGPDGNYHASWYTDMMWTDLGFFDWGNGAFGNWGNGGNGGSSSSWTNKEGSSVGSILSMMNFGDRFGRNKSGILGFWSKFVFDPGISGDGQTLETVGVGTKFTRLYNSTQGNNDNSLGEKILETGIQLTPYIGGGYDFYYGVKDGDWLRAGIGVLSLGLDIFTFGSAGTGLRAGRIALREGLNLAAKTGAKKVEQYALRAAENGFYPVMKRGFARPQELVFLEKGEVWKFGTTKNPFTRYTQNALDNTGAGLRYTTEFSGTLSEARTLESMKILNFKGQNGILPAGNKIVR